ncbi:Ig-like domain-containing protein [Paenibacillus macerans]|uniref:Ig-like domain-containing protein n=1 Tax=Paenibacillus macerans TaxID=44252 RepID=UPI002041EC3A|nr:Ig-like domain-containing protein [Paenibacillus macerans]MCM3698447.1 Ig-like domain-containing protein [Paenibacillus macerans]
MVVKRKMTKWFLVLALLLTAVFPTGVFAATGDVSAISIDGENTTIELKVGSSKQLKVWASIEGSTTKKDVTGVVTWTSSENILSLNNGMVTPFKSGTSIIQASYQGSVSMITIKAVDTYSKLSLEYKQGGKYSLDSDGDDLKVKALALNDNSSVDPRDVTEDADWSSSNTSVLTIEKGVIKIVGEGKATIKAQYSGMTASFEATVSSPYAGLKLYRAAGGTEIGENEDLELILVDNKIELLAKTVLASDKSASDVSKKATWSSSDTSVATVDDGTVEIISMGKTTITASYMGQTASVDIYVRAPHEAILFTPSSDPLLFVGETLQISAGIRVAANETTDVSNLAEWSSSNKLIATVDSNGQVTAKSAGSTTIKAKYQGVSKSLTVTVHPTITKLEAEKTEMELLRGESASLPDVKATKVDGDKVNFNNKIVWSSDNEEVVTIENGRIVAKDGNDLKLSATATITGKLEDIGSGLTPNAAFPIRGTQDGVVTVKVTVKEKVLTLISEEEKMSIVMGEEISLPKITAVFENGEEVVDPSEIDWSVTGTNAVLKTAGSGKKIKGLAKGSATLKGTYSNKTISIPVTIEKKISKIVVEPQSIELNLKKSKSIKVTGYYTDGTKINLSSKMDWKSSDEKVATIPSSSVKAVAVGTATLTSSYQGNDVSVKVSVVPKLKKLYVDEKRLALSPGAVKSVVVTAEYDTGETVVVTSSATWTSSKPSVAKVTAGKIEAVAKGSSSIKAKYGGKTVTVSVSVKVEKAKK